jgi:hypothetical protein
MWDSARAFVVGVADRTDRGVDAASMKRWVKAIEVY